jgi:hypothetical protein
MDTAPATREEIARRANVLYQEQIRAQVEPEQLGKFLALDITTGAYEIDSDELRALDRARTKNPNAVLYLLRVGRATTYRLGATLQVNQT